MLGAPVGVRLSRSYRRSPVFKEDCVSAFVQRLSAACQATESLLCVGLDPDPPLMPLRDVVEFNRAIVDATKGLVCAYKPNLSFYEALGLDGLKALRDTVSYIRDEAPGAVVIGDAKRGDVGSSSASYARALFEYWGFDAATVNGYAGRDSLEPFFEYEDRGVFVLCRSSNPGATEVQDLLVSSPRGENPLYQVVAERAGEWNTRGNVGLVVGATYPTELESVRAICPGMPILLPGVGAQGGDVPKSVAAGADASGRNLIVSSSRGIIYASRDEDRFATAARRAAEGLRNSINLTLQMDGKGW